MNSKTDCISYFCISEEFFRKAKEKLSSDAAIGHSIVSLDFDNLNFINDLFGPSIGDAVLQNLEQHFMKTLSDGEFFTRMHGDHFVFWVKSITPQKLIDCFSNLSGTVYLFKDILPQHYNLICSGGIVDVSEDHANLSDLLGMANFSRKWAKGKYKNCFIFFNPHMDYGTVCDFEQDNLYLSAVPSDQYKRFLNLYDKDSNPDTTFANIPSKDYKCTTELTCDFSADLQELYALCKNIDMGLMKGYIDKVGVMHNANNKALECLGYSRQEFRDLFGNNIIGITHPEDVHKVTKNSKGLLTDSTQLKFKSRVIRKDGKVITLQVYASIVVDTQGKRVGIYAFHDITEGLENIASLNRSLTQKIAELEQLVESERKSREALRLSEERYKLIIDQSDDIMYEWDFETDEIYFSDKFEDLLGKKSIDKSITNNPNILNLVYPDDHTEFKKWLASTYKMKGFSQSEFRLLSDAGFYVWVRSRSTAICNELGKPIKAIGVFTNISKEKSEINSLVIKTRLDPLTQLYNKEETKNQIEAIIHENPNKLCAFFIVDIDNFKGINDNLGHQFGDTVLQEVSHKIKKIFRDNDIIGRIGGDEIVIFMRNAFSENIIKHKADMLVQILRNTYFGANTTHSISASVGIALFPTHSKSFSDLYQMADTALYKSKNKGKDRFTIYNPTP